LAIWMPLYTTISTLQLELIHLLRAIILRLLSMSCNTTAVLNRSNALELLSASILPLSIFCTGRDKAYRLLMQQDPKRRIATEATTAACSWAVSCWRPTP
jgi:hypothetical protein